MKKILLFVGVLLVLVIIAFRNCISERISETFNTVAKPVIYLYPEKEEKVKVKLDVKKGKLTTTYPKYNGGWEVIAQPNGMIKDVSAKEYNYLYWEAETSLDYDFSRGFCIKGKNTAEFLEKILSDLGLNRKEANEFIVYWLPRMESNNYNLISFQDDVYRNNNELRVDPKPDTVIRVFMAWKPLEKEVEIEEQKIDIPKRNGFTVVEWGGVEIK